MTSHWLATGAVLDGLAVALGAFGAHGLKARVDADLLAVFETGVRWLGAITPIGGVAFILGWAALAVGVLRG